MSGGGDKELYPEQENRKVKSPSALVRVHTAQENDLETG